MADLLMIGLGVDTRRLRDGERALNNLQKQVTKQRRHFRMASKLASVLLFHKIIEYADAYTNYRTS